MIRKDGRNMRSTIVAVGWKRKKRDKERQDVIGLLCEHYRFIKVMVLHRVLGRQGRNTMCTQAECFPRNAIRTFCCEEGAVPSRWVFT